MRTVTAVQSLLFDYQLNYNYNRKYKSKGVSNQIMFTQCGKNGEDEGKKRGPPTPLEETFTTLPAMIVGKNSIIQETVNPLHKQISKRIQKLPGRRKKENTGTSLLLEEEKKNW